MTEIKVILDTDVGDNIDDLTYDERELLFDQMAVDNPDISRSTIMSFSEMQTDLIAERVRLFRPNLKELLLRKIILLSQNHGSELNTIVIPIIHSLKMHSKLGGLANSPESKSIKIRFDSRILTSTNDIDYIAGAGEELDVIGIVVNPICSNPKISIHNGLKRLQSTIVTMPTIGERLLLGNFTYPEASRACDGYFLHPDYGIRIAGTTFDKSHTIMFGDLDDVKIMRVFNSIYDYLTDIESHHLMSGNYIQTQLNIAIKGIQNTDIKTKLVELFKIHETHPLLTDGTETPKHPIFNILDTIGVGKFSGVYKLALLGDVDMRGFGKIYQRALIAGVDDPEVHAAVIKQKELISRTLFQRSITAKATDEMNKLNMYRIIIAKKFGPVRAKQIEKNIVTGMSAKKILDLLKPNERKPVEIEFEKKQKYLEAVINNKCPHVKLYRQFRLSKETDRSKKLYTDLRRFFKSGGSNQNTNQHSNHMISCNNCGFDIMCPHVSIFTEMEFADKSHSEIRSKLTKFIDSSVVKDQYYCKICGEMISSLEAFGDSIVRDPSSMMNEELKSFMWSEIAILTKYLKFGNLVNVSQLISTARDVCYPFIFEIEKQILKSKTNSSDEIKAKKRLYVTIYAFAYFIRLVISNRSNDIGFKNFNAKGKNIIVDMIKYAIDSIIMSRNIIIREIPGMSPDIIKNTIIDAYKSLHTIEQVIVYSGEAEDLLTTLMLDPIYHYFYTIIQIDGLLNGKKVSKGKFDIVDAIPDVMGGSIAKLEKQANIFENARVGNLSKWNMGSFDDFGTTNKIASGDIWVKLYPGYAARSFKLFNSGLTKGIYKEPVYIDVSSTVGGIVDPTAPMNVKLRPAHQDHHDEYISITDAEDNLLKYRAKACAHTYKFLPAKHTLLWVDPGSTLGRVFDEDGNLHNWDIYVVLEEPKDEKTKEYKLKDITNMIESGSRFTGTIIDRKCSICGILRSVVDNIQESKILSSLHSKRIVDNFFRFYENRCPKGGLHTSGDKCTKCNFQSSYISQTADGLAYYNEFKSVYLAEKSELNERTGEVLKKVVTIAIVKPDFSEYYQNWTPNFNVILDLANKLKINHRLLAAMGAIEKTEYEEVLNGTFIPGEVEERNSTRIYVVEGHIKNLLTEYNQVRFFYRLVKPPIDLSLIIDGSGINKHNLGQLSKSLPDVFSLNSSENKKQSPANYNIAYEWFRQNKKPRETVAFVIQSFCEMVLGIWIDNTKETEKLRHDFVRYIVKKILRSEEMVTKSGQFNWSLLYGDKEKTEKTYDMNENPNLDKETDVEFDDSEKHDEEFGDSGAPLSLNDLDTETADLGEDDNGEDAGNQIRVGDNYGLD